jgi:hypothetical protein
MKTPTTNRPEWTPRGANQIAIWDAAQVLTKPWTKSDMARETAIPFSRVSNVIDKFLLEGLIEETEVKNETSNKRFYQRKG